MSTIPHWQSPNHLSSSRPTQLEIIRHDITFPLYVEVVRVCNLACQASPVHSQRNPVQTIITAVHGAVNMLVLGFSKRVRARILQASASEVYGDPEALHKPLPLDVPKRCQPDISLAKGWFSWKPTVTLENGLIGIIAYFWKILNV